MNGLLRLENVSKRFGNIVACDQLSVEFWPGTCTAIIGPNGAGKTTILNVVSGALIPDQGSVRWTDNELVGLDQHLIARLGIVRMFQDLKVFEALTVYENLLVAAGCGARGAGDWSLSALKRRRSTLVERTLEQLGLRESADRPARELSYAERKLVALGRTVCSGGRVFLLDEPASGLDKASSETVLSVVGALRDSGATVVVVEHNLSIVQQLASRALLLEEGKVIADGTPVELFRNSNFGRVYFSLQH